MTGNVIESVQFSAMPSDVRKASGLPASSNYGPGCAQGKAQKLWGLPIGSAQRFRTSDGTAARPLAIQQSQLPQLNLDWCCVVRVVTFRPVRDVHAVKPIRLGCHCETNCEW